MTAIAIPVFTAQLEKSRESIDLANIRSAYAEVAVASLTDPDHDIEAEVPLKQTQAKWQTTGANVAGIDITADIWDVKKDGKIAVKYTAGVYAHENRTAIYLSADMRRIVSVQKSSRILWGPSTPKPLDFTGLRARQRRVLKPAILVHP